MHLGRVYRKLDIGSRHELPKALGSNLAEAGSGRRSANHVKANHPGE